MQRVNAFSKKKSPNECISQNNQRSFETFLLFLFVSVAGQARRERPWWCTWTARPGGLFLHCCNEYRILHFRQTIEIFFSSLQGFPGDMGPPGENGLEGPKVSKAIVLAVHQLANVWKIPNKARWRVYSHSSRVHEGTALLWVRTLTFVHGNVIRFVVWS